MTAPLPAPADHLDGYACARAWAALGAAHARVTTELTGALDAACGLSVNEFEVLLRIDRAPPPGPRLTELRSAVPLTQPSLSRLVARLAGQGWLTRRGDPADRRGIRLALTPAGHDLLRQAVTVHSRTIRAVLLDRLSEAEQELLATALNRIADHHDDEGSAAWRPPSPPGDRSASG